MRVIDTFPFFNELELLEARCAELRGSVDFHLLIEAYQTHRGHAKPLYYHDNRRKYHRKYKIMQYAAVLPDGVGDAANWARENHQRDAAIEHLSHVGLQDDDLVLATDVDEIPAAAALPRIAEMSSEGPVRLAMPLWYYSLEWEVARGGETVIWTHGVAFRWRDRPSSITDLRLDFASPRPVVPDAGWHLSWFGDSEDRLTKLHAFAHEELDTAENNKLFAMWQTSHHPEGMLDALGSPLKRSTHPISPVVTDILRNRRRRR